MYRYKDIFSKIIIIAIVILSSAFLLGNSDKKIIASPVEKIKNQEKNSKKDGLSEASDEKKPFPLKKEEELIIVEGKIRKSTVYEELRSKKIPSAEILNLSKCFKDTFDFKNARPRDCYTLKLKQDGTLKTFLYKTDILNEYVAEKNDDGSFKVYKNEITPEVKILASEFIINSSLYKAIISGGEKRQLVADFADIFSWDIDFYLYPRKGDKIQILYEKQFVNGKFSGYGKILAAKYIGKKDTFSAFLYKDQKFKGYYDANGRPLRKMFLRVPVKFGVKTSSFSIRRFHPVTKKYKAHTGIDYGARKGTPIFATANGIVIFSGWQRGYGKLVILKHPNGYKTYYGHCNSLLAKKGEYVKQSQVIAKVGKTGIATGPHVHYEVRINNKPVNPNTVKTTRGKSIPEEELEKFKLLVKSMEKTLKSELENRNMIVALKGPKEI